MGWSAGLFALPAPATENGTAERIQGVAQKDRNPFTADQSYDSHNRYYDFPLRLVGSVSHDVALHDGADERRNSESLPGDPTKDRMQGHERRAFFLCAIR